jgi:hypothetical protein
MGEIDHLMEQSKWQSRTAEKEMEGSAERIGIYRRGSGALLLLGVLFDEKAEEVPGYERLREIVQTVDEVVATLPVQARALLAERYGLGAETALSDIEVHENRRPRLSDVLRMLRHPKRSRRLRRLMSFNGWEQ